ncbi:MULTISPECIES: TetR/AcrR family transcriptional regulator [unclassified Streptomyces]|uniref:TetR/AcrR family transcriptional regulator n=1 Tax=unclassified Streptomyces TaxID=2593676 RepID=UPI0027E240CC|nr:MULTISPECIES: TetR/AcrR family transcriptional regulator [unclassified Streptomyces]
MQRRGKERRQAILDAAAAVLAEQGYEAATLKAIGERAGIPTASVYYYFSDRHEVEAELMQSHMTELGTLIGAALDSPGVRTLHDAVDAVIDTPRDYFRRHRSCVELWFAGEVAPIVRAFDESQADRAWDFFIERGMVRAETPRLVAHIAWEAGNRLFEMAFRRSATGDAATIEEARRLVGAYLATYAPAEPQQRRR